jgi:hypothetical protein
MLSSVANNKFIIFLLSVSFSIAHCRSFCKISSVLSFVATCQAVLPSYSVVNKNFIFIFLMSFSLTQYQKFRKISTVSYFADTCHTVVPSLPVANKNLLFISSVVRIHLAQPHSFCDNPKPFHSSTLCRRSFPYCLWLITTNYKYLLCIPFSPIL